MPFNFSLAIVYNFAPNLKSPYFLESFANLKAISFRSLFLTVSFAFAGIGGTSFIANSSLSEKLWSSASSNASLKFPN